MTCYAVFFYPKVFPLNFGVYVFERDASTVDISLKRSHFFPKPNSSGKKKKHSCLIRILPFIPSHRCLIILEWQASGACPCDELILFHLFFFFSTVGSNRFPLISCAFGKTVRQIGNTEWDPTFSDFAFRKWNKKLILQLKCFWSALELHWFPAITHLRLLFPSLCW